MLKLSNFITNCHPVVSQVVPSSEYLQVIAVWHQFLDVFINFSWFLALPSPVAEDYIRCYIFVVVLEITFESYQASLLSMLKIKAVTFCYLPIHCLFHPVDRINHFVSPLFFHYIHSPLEFGVDDPNK